MNVTGFGFGGVLELDLQSRQAYVYLDDGRLVVADVTTGRMVTMIGKVPRDVLDQIFGKPLPLTSGSELKPDPSDVTPQQNRHRFVRIHT
jgi:hypothetical protein